MAQEEEVAASKAAQADSVLKSGEKPGLFGAVVGEMSMTGLICGGAYFATSAILGVGYFPPLLGVLYGIVGAPIGLVAGALVGLFGYILLVVVLKTRLATSASSGALAAGVALSTAPVFVYTLEFDADDLVWSLIAEGRFLLMLLVIQTTALTVALNNAGILRPTRLSSFLIGCGDVFGRKRFVAYVAGSAGLLGSVLSILSP